MLAFNLGDINHNLANSSTRVPPSTSVTSTAASPTLWQGARLQPRRHQPQSRRDFGKALAFNLGDINHSLINTSARRSPSTSVTSIAVSPTLRQGLFFNLGNINRSFANTSARGSPSTSVTPTAPSSTPQQGAHLPPR
jgi:hypothetical protein